MNKWLQRALLLLILFVAAGLRLTGLDWDGYEHYHPDERFITWVATTIERPSSFATALNPTESTINPFYWSPNAESAGIVVPQDEHRDFAYGHVPLYLGVMATRLAEQFTPLAKILPEHWLVTRDILNSRELVEFRHLTAVSRALTALFDVGTVLFVFLLGRRLYDEKVGLLAAAFLALNVMHIQLAHFFTSDPYLTFFVVGAIFCMVKSVQVGGTLQVAGGRWQVERGLLFLGVTAVFVGLAVGSKFSAVLLFLPLLVTVYFGFERWQRLLIFTGLVAFVTFALTNPFALLDFSCEAITPAMNLGPVQIPALDWRSCYLDNIGTQRTMVGGSVNIPFTLQYDGTIPYWYYIETQLRWGMGFLLGLVAFVGFAWAIWQGIRGLGIRDQGSGVGTSRITHHVSRFTFSIPHLPSFILLSWTVPFFLVTGAFYVKFMRYLQPLTPFLMIYAAAFLLSFKWKWVRRVSITAVLLFTSLYALAFVSLYDQTHPWIIASQWVFNNVEPGAMILSEQWDDSLPSTMRIDGEIRYRSEYPNGELIWLTYPDGRDDLAKLEANLELLAEADYLTLMTHRGYGTVGRLTERYPLSSQYYPLLLDGSLGYEPVFVVGRSPNLAGIHLYADTFAQAGLFTPEMVAEWETAVSRINLGPADESFLVYDQPLTIIFENVERKSAEELISLFEVD